MTADPVRLRAWTVLRRVSAGQPLDRLLDTHLGELREARDRRFLAELVRGTLQWQGRYDHLIAHFSRKSPPSDLDLKVLLRLSLHQLLGMTSVPPFAAIHQAGELCKRVCHRRFAGFVNGLLQGVRRRLMVSDAGSEAQVSDERLGSCFADLKTDPAAWLAAWHSHPRWLVERWLERHGESLAAALCRHNNEPVGLVFHVLPPHEPALIAAAMTEHGLAVAGVPGSRALTATSRPDRSRIVAILEAFPQLIVQDIAVQEATAWLCADLDLPAGLPVLDLCAAPGGKAMYLASVWSSAHPLLAMDLGRGRMDLLEATARRTGLPLHLCRGNGLQPPLSPGSLAAVLLDGPCSGTGVLRHHPEGRWALGPGAPAERGGLLLQLARAAVDLLAPGGVLMYATCSLEAEENQDVVAALLEGDPGLETWADDQGRWQRQWWPQSSGGDGFFAARLRRRSGR